MTQYTTSLPSCDLFVLVLQDNAFTCILDKDGLNIIMVKAFKKSELESNINDRHFGKKRDGQDREQLGGVLKS
ncbi:uncharacterized protein PHALS_12288 [Plasmopara halstedii]|uniref:Uncharacterized protein n=1 Tax=Plasmopara halstedii TaxID=4781 RepID=A0A0P1AKQ2_PLAHL|nr:uncharacterized protein PHALS_12288 [Plasmopara halstedii]CEG41981.1 hypothetical protein PHALS_12288 [Plasmopara halstedii]|eukprot:XP_024578350.1 hypothetical protein PHALS_12288 [Plasmopara halstedii]